MNSLEWKWITLNLEKLDRIPTNNINIYRNGADQFLGKPYMVHFMYLTKWQKNILRVAQNRFERRIKNSEVK